MIMQVETDYSVWTSHRSGKTIKIVDMIDDYLQFTIAMIKRGYDASGEMIPPWCDEWLPSLEAEAIKRGLVPKEDGWDE